MDIKDHNGNITLVLGGTGKTGRRVAKRLLDRNLKFRIGSRFSEPPFDWENQSTWAPVLQNVHSVYLNYYPDLAMPGAVDAIRSFTDLALHHDIKQIVLLSGRGEEEAQQCERVIQNSGVAWTIVRSSWFSQNFSEGFFRELVLSGQVALPAGTVGEPFVDVEDIADVAVAALSEAGHAEQVYELTGPRLLTFARAVEEISEVTGRKVEYTQISHEAFTSALTAQGVPADAVAFDELSVRDRPGWT